MKASRKLLWVLAAPLLFVAPACDSADDDDDSGDSGGDGNGDGTTPCGMFGEQEVFCQAGQYCVDSVLAMCENGCLNNANCSADQTCDKAPGDDVGTCQNNTPTPTGPTQQEVCDKLLTCDPSATMEQCATFYDATNDTCHQCIVDGNCGDINNNGLCDAACGL